MADMLRAAEEATAILTRSPSSSRLENEVVQISLRHRIPFFGQDEVLLSESRRNGICMNAEEPKQLTLEQR